MDEPRFDRPLTDGYWAMLELRQRYLGQPTPALPWPQPSRDDPLTAPEQLMLDHLRGCERVLDIGAGDNTIKHRLASGGLTALHETVDRSHEVHHDFYALEDAPSQAYDAVLMLEVVEHVPLADFDGFIDEVLRVLRPGGKLVLTTPNTAHFQSIWNSDMTHVHAYRLQDLAAYLHLRGVPSTVYRIVWRDPKPSIEERLRLAAQKFLARKVLEMDYARGVMLLGTREVLAPAAQ